VPPAPKRVPGRPQRPLRRSADDCILGGVCGGIARRLGVSSKTVRVLTVMFGLILGFGIVWYVAMWVLVTRQGEEKSILSRTGSDRREKEILSVGTIGVFALLLALRILGINAFGFLTLILALSALGFFVVWRGASDAERRHLHDLTNNAATIGASSGEGWRGIAVRTVVSVVLIIVAVANLSSVSHRPGAGGGVVVGAIALLFGLIIMFAPWWIGTVRGLSQERRARVRAQERADMAAHVHDSVLQTLSLIQRAADNPVEVARLVRMQERDLRSWLVDPESFGLASNPPTTLAETALEIEHEVEDTYAMAVEVVVVGDCSLDAPVLALLGAGREAAINAAKWSGAPSVSIYLEVEPEKITMFIRDLGHGFDPTQVTDDRQGISGSIVERMARHGGKATIRSSPGHGTEVELELPRKTAVS
jgi:signal transduction histidine kinase/phage shock protein PspC (stress-responsive transcriptional regulator)